MVISIMIMILDRREKNWKDDDEREWIGGGRGDSRDTGMYGMVTTRSRHASLAGQELPSASENDGDWLEKQWQCRRWQYHTYIHTYRILSQPAIRRWSSLALAMNPRVDGWAHPACRYGACAEYSGVHITIIYGVRSILRTLLYCCFHCTCIHCPIQHPVSATQPRATYVCKVRSRYPPAVES